MESGYFWLVCLVVGVLADGSCGASIGDALIEEAHSSAEEILPVDVKVIETQPLAIAREEMRLVAEEPKLLVEEVESDLPFDEAKAMREEMPGDIVPVMTGDENCEKTEAFVEEQLIERAERQANEDLDKALDTILVNKETLKDVIRSEDIADPPM